GVYRSDGTKGGTKPVSELFRLSAGLRDLIIAGPSAYFVEEGAMPRIWQTDGTAQGTTPVLRIKGRISASASAVGRTLFYAAETAVGRGLFRWRPGVKPVLVGKFEDLILLPERSSGPLWFAAQKLSREPWQIWRYDGQGVHQVTQFSAGAISDSTKILPARNALLFSARGSELWHAGNRDPAARLLHRFADPRPDAGGDPMIAELAGTRDALFVKVADQRYAELWRKSGPDAIPASFGLIPRNSEVAPMADRVLFPMPDATRQNELCSAAASGAVAIEQVSDLIGAPTDSDMRMLTPFKGGMLFFTNAPRFGRSQLTIWHTDGVSGPRVVSRIGHHMPDDLWTADPDSTERILAGDVIYFSLLNGTTSEPRHEELWKTNGTAAGTRRVSRGFSSLHFLGAIGRKVFFANADSAGQDDSLELWVTDGTAAGTTMLRKFTGPLLDETLVEFVSPVVSQEALYFIWAGQLWRSDGTPAGTVNLNNTLSFTAELEASRVYVRRLATQGASLIVGGDIVLPPSEDFFDFPLYYGLALWKISPGSAVPQVLKEVKEEAGDLRFADLRVSGDRRDLWITALRFGYEAELYRLDANTGAVLAHTSLPNATWTWEIQIQGEIDARVVIGPTTSSSADAPLTISDGTPGGTGLLGTLDGLQDGVALGEKIVFARGSSLWHRAGASPAELIRQFNDDSAISELVQIGNKLFFIADDGEHGNELWAYSSTTL
ncbi:MAG TPA: hypothetical protein VNL70_05440, partial [Tepidisphaeraceae bacterium]|nr:hypothetical protein [Tepidisphaeraceae bacterium]